MKPATFVYLQFMGALLALAVFDQVWWAAIIFGTQIVVFCADEICDAIKGRSKV